ncbi:phage holin family protein [Comamonadaceae bacterium G21597-S1]|nr:phage holin family protein [Comamonadaceae bacterium G21597-S1]
MANFLYALIITLHLVGPALAQEPHKNPLSYSLREYGLILAIAMLGGFVRWYNAVRRGESAAYDLRILVGELFTSAFIGILTFWACEAFNVQPLVTAALAGMAGHAGVSGLLWAEKVMKTFFERKYGVQSTDRAPLDKQ